MAESMFGRILGGAIALLASGSAWAGVVKVTAADGVVLAGETWGKGARAVLLVHDAGRTRSDWATLAPRLAASGFRVLALDLRGHGGSTLPTPLPDTDWTPMVADVAAGAAWLAGQGATEVHVVGERLGASLALAAAAADPHLVDVVVVSPVLVDHGVKVSTSVAGLHGRPLLAVTGADDAPSKAAATWLATQVGGGVVETYPNVAGAGGRLVNSAPEVATRIVTWVDGGYAAKAAAAPAAGPADQLQSGSVGTIETNGTRLEDRKR